MPGRQRASAGADQRGAPARADLLGVTAWQLLPCRSCVRLARARAGARSQFGSAQLDSAQLSVARLRLALLDFDLIWLDSGLDFGLIWLLAFIYLDFPWI